MSGNATPLREMQDAKPIAVTLNDKPPPAGAPVSEVTETPHYIGGRMVQPGEHVQYAGKPGRFLRHVSGPEWKPDPDAKSTSKPV